MLNPWLRNNQFVVQAAPLVQTQQVIEQVYSNAKFQLWKKLMRNQDKKSICHLQTLLETSSRTILDLVENRLTLMSWFEPRWQVTMMRRGQQWSRFLTTRHSKRHPMRKASLTSKAIDTTTELSKERLSKSHRQSRWSHQAHKDLKVEVICQLITKPHWAPSAMFRSRSWGLTAMSSMFRSKENLYSTSRCWLTRITREACSLWA